MLLSNDGIWPKRDWDFVCFFLYCRVKHDLGWALLEPCKANNSGDCPRNCWCFLGRFSCGMFVSVMQPLGDSASIPEVPGEPLFQGPPWSGRSLCARTKGDCVSRGEREGRGLGGSFRGTAGMDPQPQFPENPPCDPASAWEIRSAFIVCKFLAVNI